MDFEKVSRELLHSIRGARSQAGFSRRLGYRTNVVHAWEAGRRWPAASETLRAAQLAGVDVADCVARFYRTAPAWLREVDCTSPPFITRFLSDQRGDAPVVAVASRAGVNRYTMARWFSGASEPRLPDFLRVVEAASLRLVDLLACLVDPAALPSVAPTWRRHEAVRSLAIDTPWAMGVLRALEVPTFGGAAAVVADALRLDPAEVARCLVALERAGLVERRQGRWRPRVVETLDTRRSPETARRLKAFWGKVGLDRLEAGAEGAFAYNVMSISHDQLRRLRELHDAYFQAARAIVAEEQPPECVALLHLQLLRLDVPEVVAVRSTL